MVGNIKLPQAYAPLQVRKFLIWILFTIRKIFFEHPKHRSVLIIFKCRAKVVDTKISSTALMNFFCRVGIVSHSSGVFLPTSRSDEFKKWSLGAVPPPPYRRPVHFSWDRVLVSFSRSAWTKLSSVLVVYGGNCQESGELFPELRKVFLA